MRPLEAVINLSAIRHNLGVAKRLSGHARIAAAVKADAYGHGATAILPALGAADWLAVACIEEAMALRDAGARQPILLLEGVFEASEYAICAARDFEVVIHHQSQLAMLQRTPLGGRIRVWLKFDSGMGRLGMTAEQVTQSLAALEGLAWVAPPVRLMTHFAAADETDPTLTQQQWQAFERIAGDRGLPMSAANSAGILFHPMSHADICRPGLMLYGAGPDVARAGRDLGLRPAMRLRTEVIALRQVPSGATIGYGASWRAERPSLIATIAAGYGDGYPRAASNRAVAWMAGREVPVVGRVSMDMITLDVTDLTDVAIGDPVLLWGAELPIERLAESAGTIAYDVMCGTTARVRRIYVDDDSGYR